MNKLSLNPFADRIICRKIEESTKTPGGVIMPHINSGKPVMEVEVMAMGPGKLSKSGETLPSEVYVGDRILIGRLSGTPIKVDSEEYLLVDEDSMLGILEVIR